MRFLLKIGSLGLSIFTATFAVLIFSGAAFPRPVLGEEIKIKYFGLTSGRLAFTYRQGENRDIYVLDFAALTVTPLITSPALDEYPRWSPDGQLLAFYSERDGDRDIYTADAEGGDIKRLTDSPGRDDDPDWSPDGKRIVFQSTRGGQGSDLYVMNADGSDQQKLGLIKKRSTSTNSIPRWSPRGDEILYVTNEFWPGWDISVYNVEQKTSKVLTNGYQSFSRAGWHPDGSNFVFSYGARNDIDIWQFTRGGSSLAPLIVRPGRDYDAEWNHQGTHLFFVSELTPGSGDYQLFVWEKREDRIKQVLSSPGTVRHPSWTPFPSRQSIERMIRAQKSEMEESKR